MIEIRTDLEKMVCPHCEHAAEDPEEYLIGRKEAELLCPLCRREILLRKRLTVCFETSGWVSR